MRFAAHTLLRGLGAACALGAGITTLILLLTNPRDTWDFWGHGRTHGPLLFALIWATTAVEAFLAALALDYYRPLPPPLHRGLCLLLAVGGFAIGTPVLVVGDNIPTSRYRGAEFRGLAIAAGVLMLAGTLFFVGRLRTR